MEPWHFLYFLPLPHGQGSLRPGLMLIEAILAERSAGGISNIHESGIPSHYAGVLNEELYDRVPGVCSFGHDIRVLYDKCLH